ncbi:MAG: FtsX-like permease family protein [Bacteroidia bacterium]
MSSASKHHPPKLAALFLKWIAGKADLEDIQGDIDEVFYQNVEQKGSFKSDWHYWLHTLSLFSSYALKKRKRNSAHHAYSGTNNLAMFKNYFKISIRNLKKQKAFTLINVAGLAMGMSIALLALAMYVDLTHFDEFHPDAFNTYRLTTKVEEAGDVNRYASSPPALTYAMDEQIAGINKSVHINDYLFPEIIHEENQISTNGLFTEPSFFELFSFPIEEGNAASLREPGTTIITKELSTKLFGDESPINKVLATKNWGSLRVTGVMKAFPQSTHLVFDLLVGFPTSKKFSANERASNWTDFHSNYYYFSIAPNQKREVERQIAQLGLAGKEAFLTDEESAKYVIQGLVDISPGDMMSDTIGVEFDRPTMMVFFGVALLILIPACFNYTNMSIAVALKRAKEVGIRKVMGSYRKQIIGQFLIETILICLAAMLLASYIFYIIRAEFLSMLVGSSVLSLAVSGGVILAFILFAILTGFFTGIVPALYFAKISPIEALRSTSANQKVSISGIRKGLLVFQFVLTLSFTIGIGVLLKQYQESRSFDYPFNVDNTFIIPTQNQDIDLIRNTYLNHPDVKNLSFSSSIPGTPLSENIYLYFPEIQDSIRARKIYADTKFAEHINTELVWGRHLDDREHQIEQVVVNQAMMNRLRTMNPLADSTKLLLSGGQNAQIIGVIKDYNHEPLNERIEPMVIRQSMERLDYAIVTIASEITPSTYARLEIVWDDLFPNKIFKASLLSNEIDNAYEFFKIGLKIFGFLAMLAISISCLGLLGMVIYATENRTKEVAIRKILGAKKIDLFQTLAGMFIKLWVIALLISVPLSYFFYDNIIIQLYNKFSDGVGAIEILGSVLVTLFLGGSAIFWQVNKIARINPANNLRTD